MAAQASDDEEHGDQPEDRPEAATLIGHGAIVPHVTGSRHPRRPVRAGLTVSGVRDQAPTASAPSRSVSRRFSA